MIRQLVDDRFMHSLLPCIAESLLISLSPLLAPNDLTIAKDGTIYVSLPPKAIWRITRDAEGQVEGKLVGDSFANGLTLTARNSLSGPPASESPLG